MTAEQQQQTIAQFIEQEGITATAERVPHNPNMNGDPEWERTAAHHLVTLKRMDETNSIEHRFEVYFSQGSAAFDRARTFGHSKMRPVRYMDRPKCDGCYEPWPCAGIITSKDRRAQPPEPKLSDVLDSLASDAAGYDNASDFEEWCGEYGYDPDSRKAETIYRACGETAKNLRRFLGATAYEALLFNTERE